MASPLPLLLLVCFSLVASALASTTSFNEDFDITWGDGRGKILSQGKYLTLSLDKYSGSGFESKNHYLFGQIDMQIKLVAGNSAGTVTTYYLSSQGPNHDEIDFEFLGNSTGEPYTLHTNVFAGGKGDREQQFHLWFDPTKNFHTYSILWNPGHVILSVDGIAIRDFKNLESKGIPFPKSQPMKIYSSLWNADDWATQGGRVKTNWSNAPFTAYYRNFNAQACVVDDGPSGGDASSCISSTTTPFASGSTNWYTHELDTASHKRMRWVKKNFMIYNYCTDRKRFPRGLPKECVVA